MNAWADNPQAVQIDALVERAGRLTGDEVKGLAAAWNAAWNAAWPAGRTAAWNAAWFAGREAASQAAWLAAWNAGRDAGRVGAAAAAWAVTTLGVRDLIDESTSWNRAAYDLLTGPWRRVIGPIHPDDEVLR